MQLAGLVDADRNRPALIAGPGFVAVVDRRGDHHAGVAIAQARGPFRGGGQFGQVRQPLFQRAKQGVDLGRACQGFDLLHRHAIGGVKGAGPGAAQPGDMTKAPQRCAQIAGNGAHIAALAADHFQLDMIGVGARQQRQAFHPQRAGGDFKDFAFARQIIGALAVDLDRGKLWRRLQDLAPERTQRRFDLRIGRAAVRGGDDGAFGIIRGGGRPEAHQEAVAFQRIGDVGHRLGRFAQRHGQNAGRRRVQRAGMAHLLRLEGPFHLVDHSGRGQPCGLVHDQPARDLSALARPPHDRPPSPESPPASAGTAKREDGFARLA